MVAQPALQQSSFNSGAISDELDDRFDLKQWHQAAKRMVNAEPVPQGGFRAAPRSRRRARIRRAIQAVTPASTTSSAGPHAAAATVRTITLSEPTAIALVAIDGFSSDVAAAAKLLVQWQDGGGAWHDFAPAFALDTEVRERMAAQAPGQPVTTSAIRIRVTDMSEAVTVTISATAIYRERSSSAPLKLKTFKYSRDEVYLFVFTPGLADVFRNGVHVGSTRCSLTGAQLSSFKVSQRFDTLFLYHPDLVSERIMRRGADHEWERDPIPWDDDIALVDYGEDYDNVVTDEWQIFVRWVGSGRPEIYLNFIVNEEETGGIPWLESESAGTLASNVEDALLALPSMKPGVSVTTLSSSGKLQRLKISFGGDNEGDAFDVSAQVVNTSTDASALVSHTQTGFAGGEPVMSAGRGWPAAGSLFQDRHLIGGFRSSRSAVAASRVGEYFDMNTRAVGPAAALLLNIGTDGAEQINHILSGRHVVIITDAKIYFISDRVIEQGQPVNFVDTSSNAAHPDADIYEIDDELYYVSRDGSLIYAMRYDDVATKYLSDPISLLASNIIEDVRWTALQRAQSKKDASRYFLGRGDGGLVLGTIIRGQEVLGFAEWTTDGYVLDGAVDAANRAWLAVSRTVGEEEVAFLEELEQDLLVDCAVSQVFDPPAAVITGLEDHEGATVWAIADGFVLGPYAVSAAEITLPKPATDVTVGRWTPPLVETLPLIRIVRDNVVLLRPGRIHTVEAQLLGTTSLAIGANGGAPVNVGLYRAGMQTDAPLAPVSGQVVVEGLTGYSATPTAIFTQKRPGSFRIRSVALSASN